MTTSRWLTGTVFSAIFAALVVPATPTESQTAHFVVARPSLYPLGLGDSYVLPLGDPDDIEAARGIVLSQGFAIVNATIVAGSDGVNRNLLAAGAPEWSWHVAEFHGFSATVVEFCDGSPTLTESEVQSWTPGQESLICYWIYTVVAEINPTPVRATTWGRIKALYAD